jgi:hypothetical protein
MATTTTNFGWDIPQSTDLVKNGATAISTLGQDIDTSLAELKGGTTGQVLSKTSNTDMDFTWVAADDTNAIQNTIVDAKGDLIAASAADTPARLAVGNNGETLVADSSTSTGLRYTAGNVNPNSVLNSAFSVWQRGTSITMSSTAYTADRWQGYRTVAGGTVSRQATGDTTNLPFIQYCARVQRDSGNTSTGLMLFQYTQESVNSIPYAGKTITFSFYARKGANYSEANSNLELNVTSGTGTDQNGITGFTGAVGVIASQQSTLTTTWQRFSYTASVGATATQLAFGFRYTPVGTAGAADYFDITGVQIDIGSVALPFRTYAGTIQGELAACQRYYWRSALGTGYAYVANGQAIGTTTGSFMVYNPVPMRINPTSLDWSALGITDGIAIQTAITTASLSQSTTIATQLATGGSSGLTQYRPYFLSQQASGSGYIGMSAEL